uniref:Ubiquitin-like domain-containing protein n=1 Tax=Cyprinus carpio carpio TaxID=630221 RepID=A0A9J7YPS0_CYPCA
TNINLVDPWLKTLGIAPVLLQPEACGPKQCVTGDPKHPKGDPVPLPEPLGNNTHAVLQVQEPVSPGLKSFPVNVFNGSNGMKISVTVRSIDTIAKLQKKVQKLKPELIGCGNLVYNGKPVQLQKKLSELQVKPEATFIIYQKCYGG